MKLALISDIHGNLPALQAVLEDIKQRGVDQVICLGDVATLGPHSAEVCVLLRETDCMCIMGNHDEAALYPRKAGDLQIAPPLFSTLEWNIARLGSGELDYLRSFLPVLTMDWQSGSHLVFYHGSYRSNTENIFGHTEIAVLRETLAEAGAGNSVALMAGGHTHIPMLRRLGDVMFVNPGSVGCAFFDTPAAGEEPRLLPLAQYAIVQDHKGAISVDLRQIAYDTATFRSALKQSDLPLKEWWLRYL